METLITDKDNATLPTDSEKESIIISKVFETFQNRYIYFPFSLKLSFPFSDLHIDGICISPNKEIFLCTYDPTEVWSKLEKTDINYDRVINKLFTFIFETRLNPLQISLALTSKP